MEIIKRGEVPEERMYEVTCSNCKTEFRFKRKEATRVSSWRNESSFHINCPVCFREICCDA